MSWIESLKIWNKDKKWSIPAKGSAEHSEVMAIKESLATNKIVKSTKKKSSEKKPKPKSKSKKASSNKKTTFSEMNLITPKNVIDFNLIVTLKNESKGALSADDLKDILSKLEPFNSIMSHSAVEDMVTGSGLSLYGSGNFKGKFKKLTNKDRSSINSLVKQNNLSLGDVFLDNTLDIVKNPVQALAKVFNLSKSLKKKADDTLNKNFKKLLTKDMSQMNKLLQSKSIGDAASKELTNKVDGLVDLFKQRVPKLTEEFVFGSGHCKKFKFRKADIDDLNKMADECQCMTGSGLDDIFAAVAQDPIGSLKKLLQFQNANSGFKKLLDSNTDPNKPKRIFVPPWEL
jgi:hypothetical protein